MSIIQREEIVNIENDQSIQARLLKSDYPDIYFIILDGYGRNDSLINYFNYDNQEFLTFLSNKGFYVTTASHSNYLQTYLSLSSTLNMDYLDDYAAKMGPMNRNPIPIRQGIQYNRLMDILANHGYTLIAFQSGYHSTELEQIEHYYSSTINISDFVSVLINLTPLQLWLDDFQYTTHRKRILFTFDQLPSIAQSKKPAFVFAHILAPHKPFVFGANGEERNPNALCSLHNLCPSHTENGRREFNKGYTEQITFINSLVQNTVEEILSKPGPRPIIVIQGDHGPRPIWDWESMENSDIKTIFPILNAYYFPDQEYSELYPDISPVNTFRLILDKYFSTQFSLLEDRSYYSKVGLPYHYVDVTDQIDIP